MIAPFDIYKAVHEQSFLPIFVKDNFETKKLIDACVEAGVKCIEYTLRRPDAHKMIPWIKQNYPKLYLFVGSTIDDEKIVSQMRTNNPQLLTLAQLDDMGVDGFISMLGFSEATIAKYASKRVLMPRASTATEALRQAAAGAHFIKIVGPAVDMVKDCRAAPSFEYCPVMFTGGANLQRIPEIVDAGAVVIGTGFDLTLKGKDTDISAKEIAQTLRAYLTATQQAKKARFPQLASDTDSTQEWLNTLPHYHPF